MDQRNAKEMLIECGQDKEVTVTWDKKHQEKEAEMQKELKEREIC